MANKKVISLFFILSISIIGCDPTTNIAIINDTPYSITIKVGKIEKTILSQEAFWFKLLGPLRKNSSKETVSRAIGEYYESGCNILYLEKHYHLTPDDIADLVVNVAGFRKNVMAYIYEINISEVINELQTRR
ncbi:MAG: hypothetical protein LBK13_05875 [Spirochaetales bacterium]|nr:hypothetical protein [Spirochaetales bacterium]